VAVNRKFRSFSDWEELVQAEAFFLSARSPFLPFWCTWFHGERGGNWSQRRSAVQPEKVQRIRRFMAMLNLHELPWVGGGIVVLAVLLPIFR
jgi:hypothetical protein